MSRRPPARAPWRHAALALLVALATTACETILGEARLEDPAPGAPCAKRETCGPGADCVDPTPYDDQENAVCLPTCGAKGAPACPDGFTCTPDSSYAAQPAHCLPDDVLESR